MNEHEEAVVRAFIVKEKQDRYRFLLGHAERKRRQQGTDRLNHCRDLNPKYAKWLPSNADVTAMLRAEGSPESVYVISDTPAIDGQFMPLEAAIDVAALNGWGTIVSCIPGRLAYYYGEIGECRAILRREDNH